MQNPTWLRMVVPCWATEWDGCYFDNNHWPLLPCHISRNHPEITGVSLLSIETATVPIPHSMPLSPTQLVLDAPQLESRMGPFPFTRLTIWKRGAPRWGVGPVVRFDHDPHVHRFSIGTQYFSEFDDRPVHGLRKGILEFGILPSCRSKKWEAVCWFKVARWPPYMMNIDKLYIHVFGNLGFNLPFMELRVSIIFFKFSSSRKTRRHHPRSRKRTWNLKMMRSKTDLLFKRGSLF